MVENLFLVQNFALLVGLSQGWDKVQIQLNKNQGIDMFHDFTVLFSLYFWIKCSLHILRVLPIQSKGILIKGIIIVSGRGIIWKWNRAEAIQLTLFFSSWIFTWCIFHSLLVSPAQKKNDMKHITCFCQSQLNAKAWTTDLLSSSSLSIMVGFCHWQIPTIGQNPSW